MLNYKMLPAYLAVGLLSVFAQCDNYGIHNTETDLRMRRDIQETELSISDSSDSRAVREKRQTTQVSATENSNWRNNYVWNKLKSKKNNGNNAGNTGQQDNRSLSGKKTNDTWKYPSQHTIMPRYNMTGFKSGALYPGSDYNSTAYNQQILNTVFTNTGNTTTVPIVTAASKSATLTPSSDKKPAKPGKSRKTKVRACVLCAIPCPSGRHRDESGLYCVTDDYDD